MLSYCFSLEAVFQGVDKNKSMKNKKRNRKSNRCRNLGDIEACTRVKTSRKKNLKFIITNYKDRFKLHSNMFSFGFSSVIPEVSVADF